MEGIIASGFSDDLGANACALNLNSEKNVNFSVMLASRTPNRARLFCGSTVLTLPRPNQGRVTFGYFE
jgi:hypothetical protein